jgi:cytochrome c oxidase subunit 2
LPTFSETLTRDPVNIAQGKQHYMGCISCHGVDGQGSEVMNAPQLAGLSRWYLQRQLGYFKKNIRGQNSTDIYGQQMSAMSALLTDEKAIENVSAYLSTLPSSQNILINTGDVIKGKLLYKNCSYCHGDDAQGNYAMNAPKLAGQHAWYLKRQIGSFQQGIRGSHPADLYGKQMILMSKILHDERAVHDVVSYINSLNRVR